MIYVFLISSVLLGVLLLFLLKPTKELVQLLLAFSGAYLLSVAVLHLLPEVYQDNLDSNLTGIYILLGIILQFILESLSKGAEHGHFHIHTEEKTFPFLLFISLSVHAFSEGLPLHHTNSNLLWAIVIHKIPIAIILTTFLINSKHSKKVIFFFLTFFALMSPLGVMISEEVLFFEKYNEEITSIIIGIFLHISTVILYESSENHKFNMKKFVAILSGVLLTIFTL